VNCIYCGSLLSLNETTVNLQKPTLRRLEKWELGYNNLLLPPSKPANLTESELAEAASVLKLSPSDLAGIIACGQSLPVARAATLEEASLVERRLREFGVETRIIADVELGVNDSWPTRIRTMEFDESGLSAVQTSESPSLRIAWPDLILIVVGRLISTRVELKEQKTARAENRILDSSEFVTDEAVMELHSQNHQGAFRIGANGFDFSCLGPGKRLLAGENLSTLLQIFRERSPLAVVDESYKSLRKLLEPVWTTEQQNESGGWRRERPGKYSIGSVNEKTNETQFMRYSLLRRYLLLEARSGAK
jgi:hypothetical protein